MTETNYQGPRIGDRVQIETRGTVRELAVRGGIAGLLVDTDNGAQLWVPLDSAVLLDRR